MIPGAMWAAAFVLVAWAGPDPRMGPHEVIAAVVDALAHNNSPLPNSGVRTTYQFASPANRRVTGPYGRFLRLVRAPPYAPLRMAVAVEYGELHVAEGKAWQIVTTRDAKGAAASFRFDVSLQKEGPCTGCWMTDGVARQP